MYQKIKVFMHILLVCTISNHVIKSSQITIPIALSNPITSFNPIFIPTNTSLSNFIQRTAKPSAQTSLTNITMQTSLSFPEIKTICISLTDSNAQSFMQFIIPENIISQLTSYLQSINKPIQFYLAITQGPSMPTTPVFCVGIHLTDVTGTIIYAQGFATGNNLLSTSNGNGPFFSQAIVGLNTRATSGINTQIISMALNSTPRLLIEQLPLPLPAAQILNTSPKTTTINPAILNATENIQTPFNLAAVNIQNLQNLEIILSDSNQKPWISFNISQDTVSQEIIKSLENISNLYIAINQNASEISVNICNSSGTIYATGSYPLSKPYVQVQYANIIINQNLPKILCQSNNIQINNIPINTQLPYWIKNETILSPTSSTTQNPTITNISIPKSLVSLSPVASMQEINVLLYDTNQKTMLSYTFNDILEKLPISLLTNGLYISSIKSIIENLTTYSIALTNKTGCIYAMSSNLLQPSQPEPTLMNIGINTCSQCSEQQSPQNAVVNRMNINECAYVSLNTPIQTNTNIIQIQPSPIYGNLKPTSANINLINAINGNVYEQSISIPTTEPISTILVTLTNKNKSGYIAFSFNKTIIAKILTMLQTKHLPTSIYIAINITSEKNQNVISVALTDQIGNIYAIGNIPISIKSNKSMNLILTSANIYVNNSNFSQTDNNLSNSFETGTGQSLINIPINGQRVLIKSTTIQ